MRTRCPTSIFHNTLFITVFLLLFGLSISARAEIGVFTQLNAPEDIATDSTGHVYIHSDATFTTTLTKFASDGAPLLQINLGGINVSEFVGSRLTRVPSTDAMLLLSPQGVIYHFTPELGIVPFLDLRPLANQVADNVYDILMQQSKSLVLGLPDYGDIAARWVVSQEVLDLFVTATTGAAGGFYFVLRLRIDFQNNAVTPQVVLTSSGTTAGTVNLPPGIAINAEGRVLTTMPFPTALGFADSLVAFGADFPENPASVPQFILRDPQTATGIVDFASLGMTTDEAGNFYVASGVVGSSICGAQGSGALVVIARGLLNPPVCAPVGGVLTRSRDVAVSPVDNAVYMTADSPLCQPSCRSQCLILWGQESKKSWHTIHWNVESL